VTEGPDEIAVIEGLPGIATSSYVADGRLLGELRESWPAPEIASDLSSGYVAADLRQRPPDAAIRIGDRFAIAFFAEPDDPGAFLALPLVRDDVLVTAWRRAVAGDGLSSFVSGVPMASERALGVDQTNTSVVVGERAIMKWFRRIGPGASRATSVIAHLDAVRFMEIPTPLGSIVWERSGESSLTIAQGDTFLQGARDGWDWCVERVERHAGHGQDPCPPDCDPWFGERLGRLVARLHAALAMPSIVIPEPVGSSAPGATRAWRAAAFATLEQAIAFGATVGDPLTDIAAGIRADLETLAADRDVRLQPVHGDLHVGQVLEWPGGLAVIDFDGNPALGTDANALRQPPERDLAQMLSSIDHVGRVVAHRLPAATHPTIDDWIARTRREFVAGLDRPPDRQLLAAFEVEQECRELVYAGRFLPRWRYAPRASLRARYGG
jgi:maltokinase